MTSLISTLTVQLSVMPALRAGFFFLHTEKESPGKMAADKKQY
ncbi:hypothetical protein ACE36G_004433 [Escherichia coli]|nr:hypothetical protein [Escherichia coli]